MGWDASKKVTPLGNETGSEHLKKVKSYCQLRWRRTVSNLGDGSDETFDALQANSDFAPTVGFVTAATASWDHITTSTSTLTGLFEDRLFHQTLLSIYSLRTQGDLFHFRSPRKFVK